MSQDAAAVLARHVATELCAAYLDADGQLFKCLSPARDHIHDMNPNTSQRAPIPEPESYRHAFVAGEPGSTCVLCFQTWPCDAYRMAELVLSR